MKMWGCKMIIEREIKICFSGRGEGGRWEEDDVHGGDKYDKGSEKKIRE